MNSIAHNIRNALDTLAASHDSAMFALLCQNPDDHQLWTLMLASPWSDSLPTPQANRQLAAHLSNTLERQDYMSIGHIVILPTSDSFVTRFPMLHPYANTGETLTHTTIRDVAYSEVIVVAIPGDTASAQMSDTPQSRDPHLNETLNPVANRIINPAFNSSINPIANRTINPEFNRTINPIFNRTINPAFNNTLNPTFNRTINPEFNHTLNPEFNNSINPSISFDANVDFVYDTALAKLFYVVSASNDIALFFDTDDTWQLFSVTTEQGIRVVFDRHNEWKYYLVPANDDVQILYDPKGKQAGTLIRNT